MGSREVCITTTTHALPFLFMHSVDYYKALYTRSQGDRRLDRTLQCFFFLFHQSFTLFHLRRRPSASPIRTALGTSSAALRICCARKVSDCRCRVELDDWHPISGVTRRRYL